MKTPWMAVAAAAVTFLVCAGRAGAQETPSTAQEPEKQHDTRWYNPTTWPNPIRWFKKDGKTASEELSANSDLEKKLSGQLEAKGVIARGTNLKNACSTFKSLSDCVASLHASHDLKVEFNCLKFDLTGVDPSHGKSSCAGPPGGKATSLAKAIELLKPDANAKAEAQDAVRRARADITDASA